MESVPSPETGDVGMEQTPRGGAAAATDE